MQEVAAGPSRTRGRQATKLEDSDSEFMSLDNTDEEPQPGKSFGIVADCRPGDYIIHYDEHKIV